MGDLWSWELEKPDRLVHSLDSFSARALFSLLALILILWSTLYAAKHIRRDYNAFLALGPGGTPSTPRGYLRICVLRLFILRNPLEPPPVPQLLHPQFGIVKELPKRVGPRPRVAGIAPQRLLTQRGGAEMYQALSLAIKHLARCHPDRLYLGISCFEKHSIGIFSHHSLRRHDRPTCNGEICHAHPSDGSLHLTLHPADVKFVIDQGWGERHPLSRENWWWGARIVPSGFVLIYAPRDEKELSCVMEIVRAAAWWVSGIELPRGVENGVGSKAGGYCSTITPF